MRTNEVMDQLTGSKRARADDQRGRSGSAGLELTRREASERRRHERRELWVYSTIGFILFLPLVMASRGIDTVRGRGAEHRGSVIDETNAKVGGLLGFVFMA